MHFFSPERKNGQRPMVRKRKGVLVQLLPWDKESQRGQKILVKCLDSLDRQECRYKKWISYLYPESKLNSENQINNQRPLSLKPRDLWLQSWFHWVDLVHQRSWRINTMLDSSSDNCSFQVPRGWAVFTLEECIHSHYSSPSPQNIILKMQGLIKKRSLPRTL